MNWHKPFEILSDFVLWSVGWVLVALVSLFMFSFIFMFIVKLVKAMKDEIKPNKESKPCACGRAH